MRYILAFLMLFFASSARLQAGWGPAGCPTGYGPGQGYAVSEPEQYIDIGGNLCIKIRFPDGLTRYTQKTWTADYQWFHGIRPEAGDPWILVTGTRQLGLYDPRQDQYFAWDGTSWTRAAEPPYAYSHSPALHKIVLDRRPREDAFSLLNQAAPRTETWPADALEPALTNGVDRSKLSTNPTWTINGRAVTEQQAGRALESGGPDTLPNDRTKMRCVIIGTREETAQAMDSMPADLKSSWLVYTHQPADWQVAQAGYVTDGRPTVYLIQPDAGDALKGKVCYRSSGQPNWGDIRKADPAYDPSRDPPHIPARPDQLTFDSMLLALVAAAALVVFGILTITTKKEKS